mgnify:CR=1 FL=1
MIGGNSGRDGLDDFQVVGDLAPDLEHRPARLHLLERASTLLDRDGSRGIDQHPHLQAPHLGQDGTAHDYRKLE